MSPDSLSTGLTFGLLIAATASDLWTRRIPNVLTISASLAGLLVQLLGQGWPGAQAAALGWLVGGSLLLLPCLLGWVGGGDVKLLAAIGALQGPGLVARAGLYGIAAGGLLSLALLIWRAGHRGKPVPTSRARIALPYGPALAIGTAVALVAR